MERATRVCSATRISVALTLGVIATIGVAWALTERAYRVIGPRALAENESAQFELLPDIDGEFVGGRYAFAEQDLGYKRLISASTQIPSDSKWFEYRPEFVPAWVDSIRTHEFEYIRIEAVESGWPLPALRSIQRHEYGGAATGAERLFVRGRWEPAWYSSTTEIDRDGLPYWPYVPGLVANILFFGAIAYALLLGANEIRALFRRACGRCPRCAYDLAGDPTPGCPECGWNREPATA